MLPVTEIVTLAGVWIFKKQNHTTVEFYAYDASSIQTKLCHRLNTMPLFKPKCGHPWFKRCQERVIAQAPCVSRVGVINEFEKIRKNDVTKHYYT